jgi:predicted aldo/keto reductase-like oxidoreductase
MGRKRATFFVSWYIKSYDDFLDRSRKGGLHDGALKARNDGLVDHLICSVHASPSDTVKIIRSGFFEGIIISYSLLNYAGMEEVLTACREAGIGVITMNSLGGGLIPQNEEFFSFARYTAAETIAEGALRFISAHPEITCILSCPSTEKELNENIHALETAETPEVMRARIETVSERLKELPGFCTGCSYCTGCKRGIDTAMFMQAYNQIYFTTGKPRFRRTGRRLLENINITQFLLGKYNFFPETTENPCIHCGACESKCTQHLPIQQRLAELFQRFDESQFSKAHLRERLTAIFEARPERIAFYPGGGYTAMILGYMREMMSDYHPEIVFFDSSPALWGQYNAGIKIENPSRIPEIKPELLLIAQYTFQDEIYEAIKQYESNEIRIVKLHDAGGNTVPVSVINNE